MVVQSFIIHPQYTSFWLKSVAFILIFGGMAVFFLNFKSIYL